MLHYNYKLLRTPRRRLCDQCGVSVIVSFCQSFCHSVSMITAKVINRFHCNLMLLFGLPIGRAD